MRPRQPLFYERNAYRRRRVMDAARILPFLGLVLILLPLLWSPQTTSEPDTATGGLYLFGVWAGLIGATFLLARRLSGMVGPDRGDAGRRDGGGGRG